MSASASISGAAPSLSSPPKEKTGAPGEDVTAFEKELQRRSAEARSGVRNLAVSTPGNRMEPVDKTKIDPEIRKAAEGMEAMFLDYMLKTMRESVPKNDMDLESPASQIYRSLLDTEYAERAARSGGIGLADQIVAYLQPDRYNLGAGHGVPKAAEPSSPGRDTGGIHEGKSVE